MANFSKIKAVMGKPEWETNRGVRDSMLGEGLEGYGSPEEKALMAQDNNLAAQQTQSKSEMDNPSIQTQLYESAAGVGPINQWNKEDEIKEAARKRAGLQKLMLIEQLRQQGIDATMDDQ